MHDHQSIDESTIEHSSWDLRNTAAGLTAFTSMPYLRPHLATWFNIRPPRLPSRVWAFFPRTTVSGLNLSISFTCIQHLYIYISRRVCRQLFQLQFLFRWRKGSNFQRWFHRLITIVSQDIIFLIPSKSREKLAYCIVVYYFVSLPGRKVKNFFPPSSLSAVCMCVYASILNKRISFLSL